MCTAAAPPPGKYDVADAAAASQVPSSSYVSKTNRFDLPDSLYAKPSTPAPGEYDPRADESVKGGSVIMHEDKRNRQSRGIFTQQEALAREVPCATKYASVPEAAVETREDAAFKSSEARFEGQGSIYAATATAKPSGARLATFLCASFLFLVSAMTCRPQSSPLSRPSRRLRHSTPPTWTRLHRSSLRSPL